MKYVHSGIRFAITLSSVALVTASASAQLTDQAQTPNAAGAGILKSLREQIATGRGNVMIPGSSRFLIARDPFRAIRRGRQIFQRKFTMQQGLGPRTEDGVGRIELDGSLGAGMSDSCAACHSVPFGGAGAGGNVFTRPDSRDAPHLFGLGLVEMLADEITQDLRQQRDGAIALAQNLGSPVTIQLASKGIEYGSLTVHPDGSANTAEVAGINADLRVRPFFAQGETVSIREFVVGAFNAEMGLESPDTDLQIASAGGDVTTPSGMKLTGSSDLLEGPPAQHRTQDPDGDGIANEIDPALVDYLEFYLLNYFKAGIGEQDGDVQRGRELFQAVGCATCHIPDLPVERDRRVADVETTFDPLNSNGYFTSLYSVGTPLHDEIDDGSGYPSLKPPTQGAFLVENFFADFKRHDLGPEFHETNFDGSVQTEFLTEPLWGVGSTPPYGHDGRSMTLRNVILRHGGEASHTRAAFLDLSARDQGRVLHFLRSLQLFPPDDTASNLDPKDPANPDYPLAGHGSISLAPLFNDPGEGE